MQQKPQLNSSVWKSSRVELSRVPLCIGLKQFAATAGLRDYANKRLRLLIDSR